MADCTPHSEAPKPEAIQPVASDKDANSSTVDAAPEVNAETVETTETAGAAAGEQAEDKPAEKVEDKPAEKVEDVDKAVKVTVTSDPPNMLKTTAQATKDKKANNKFDPSSLPNSDDPHEIRAQVEFYFSNSNLPTDKYMWQLTGGSENKPVPLSKITSFNRMRRFQPYDAVVAALKESKFLNIEGEQGKEQLTRRTPYDTSRGHKNIHCTVYIKGFGDEEPSTQFDIEAFLAKLAPIEGVRLRRTDDNLFKGSAFVEFADEGAAKTFLALEPKPQWKGHDLKIMSKQSYVNEKNELIRQGKMEPNNKKKPKFFEGKITGYGHGSGDHGSGNWKDRRDHDQRSGQNNSRGGRGGRGRGGHGGRGTRGGRGGRRGGRDQKPTIKHTTNGKDAAKAPPSIDPVGQADAPAGANTTKRALDDGGNAGEPPVKKVDTKLEATAEAA